LRARFRVGARARAKKNPRSAPRFFPPARSIDRSEEETSNEERSRARTPPLLRSKSNTKKIDHSLSPGHARDAELLLDQAAELGIEHGQGVALGMLLEELLEACLFWVGCFVVILGS
jgi:hypothetical protein